MLLFLGDSNPHQPTSNVLSAAQTLALALEQCKNSPPSPPDKDTAETINAWLESFMPVSIDLHEKTFCCWSSPKAEWVDHNATMIWSWVEKVVQLKISLRSLDWDFRNHRVIKILVWRSLAQFGLWARRCEVIGFYFAFTSGVSVLVTNESVIKAVDSHRTAESRVCQDRKNRARSTTTHAFHAKLCTDFTGDKFEQRWPWATGTARCQISIERSANSDSNELSKRIWRQVNPKSWQENLKTCQSQPREVSKFNLRRHERLTAKTVMSSKRALLSALSIHESSDNAFQLKLFSLSRFPPQSVLEY